MKKKEQLSTLVAQLKQDNPKAPLEKGYVRVEQDEQWIRKAAQFDEVKPFSIGWKDGEIKIND